MSTVWSCANTRENLGDVATPLTQGIFQGSFAAGFCGLLEKFGIHVDASPDEVIGSIYGRMYLNASFVIDAYTRIPGNSIRQMTEMLGVPLGALDTTRELDSVTGDINLLRAVPSLVVLLISLQKKIEQAHNDKTDHW